MAVEFDELLELEYEGIKLPCTDWTYQGGHDFADHRALLRPGAYQEHLGRAPYQGSFKCPLFNTPDLVRDYGQLYPLLCQRIRGKFEAVPRGRLVHPVVGPLVVAVGQWRFSGSSEARSGQELSFDWIEHTDSIAEVRGLSRSSPQGVQSQAATADAAVSAVDPSAPTTSTTISTQLATVTSGTSRPSENAQAFQAMLSRVDDVRAWATLATAEAATAQLELERLRARVLELQAQFVTDEATVRRFSLPRTMALHEVSAEVYGTVSTAALAQLQLANGSVLSNPLAIPGGTTLRIPPLVNV